ncbi:MAG: hypothetical protein HUJ76_10965, partial [Parasporobacterium sp.]|nr:hypothetical protein [Parasporobacterium sp.]
MKQSVRNSTIKKLRWKFVTVTMCLVTVTFGILISADYYYTKYWEEESALEALEWYNENELAGTPIIERELFLDDYVNPIFSVDLNENMEIINVTSSSTIGRNMPAGEEIISMIKEGDDNRWESYIFVIKKHKDGYHMVLTDMSEGKAGLYRTIGTLCLILLGFGIMLVISIILSRFVTEPAKMALEREKQFVSDASHELKTPLSAISINAQALNAEFGDAVPEGSRHLDNIISETGRMNQLVQNLLKLSYIDEMSGDIEKKEFNLSKCCEGMLLTMESVIYEKGIGFAYEIGDDIRIKG